MSSVVALAVDISLKYGDYLLAKKQHLKAVSLFKECLQISQKAALSNLVVASLGKLGGAYFISRDIPQAISCFERALEITKEQSQHDEATMAFSKILANLYRSIGDFLKANFHFLNYSILSKKHGATVEVGERKSQFTHVYRTPEECREAITEASTKLVNARQSNDKQMEAEAYSTIGFAYRMLRDFTHSITYFEKHLELCRELGNTSGQGIAFGNLGPCYRALGEIKKAMDCFEKEIQISELTSDKMMKCNGYTNLGLCYLDVGDYQKAVPCFAMSLSIAKAAGFKAGEGAAYSNLSNAYFKLRDPSKALSYSQMHLRLATEMGDRRAEATSCGCLGNAYHALGEHETSMKYFQRCAELAKEAGDKTALTAVEINLGLVFESLNDFKNALIKHQAALKIAQETGNRVNAGEAMSSKGRCLLMLEDYTGAIASYEKCIKEYEDIRANLGTDDSLKISIGDLHTRVYKALAYTMLHVHQAEEALLAADRGRAMALKDLLYFKFEVKNEYSKITAKSEDINRVSEYLDKLRNDADVTTLFYSFIEGKMYTFVISSSQVRVVKWPLHDGKNFLKLLEVIEIALAEIGEDMRNQEELEGRMQATSIAEKDNANDIFLDDVLSSFDKIHAKSDVPSAERHNVQAIRDTLARSRLEKAKDFSDPISSLQQLYQILIEPVEELIQGNKLLIIPEFLLYRLPFAALVDNRGRFLCQRFSIQLCTSLETLSMISCRPKRELIGGALVVGNPLVGSVHRRRKEINPCALPGAQKEAEKVASFLHTSALLGQMATKSRVLHHLVKASVIHIAAHGDPIRGEIFLAPNPDPARINRIPSEEEYLLTCGDIAELSLRARLVVLSCCQSAQGDIRAEGVVGIARAFLGAGARAVMVTLWAIDDDTTLSFMELFYNHFYQNMSVCQALQQTMVLMQANEELKKISMWAPFYVIGDDIKFNDTEINKIREKAFAF